MADDAFMDTDCWDAPFWDKWETWRQEQAFSAGAQYMKIGKASTPILDVLQTFQLRLW
jgi:hypothetical protein